VRKYFFWSWLLLSVFLSLTICLVNFPIRDLEYFPLLDMIKSVLFLTGGVLLFSSIMSILLLVRNIKTTIYLGIIMLFLIVFFGIQYSVLPLFILGPIFIILLFTIGLVHFIITYFIGKNLYYSI